MDLALADVVATSTDQRLGAIRLAWWRERLEELADAAPAEPRLSAIQRQLLGRGISGRELAELEDAWLPLLDPFPWGADQADGLRLRGRLLFGIGTRLLGGEAHDAEPAGEVWSLVDGATHCSDPQSRDFLLEEARRMIGSLPPMPRTVRPLTVLTALVASDALGSGKFGRVATALRHRLTGGFPH